MTSEELYQKLSEDLTELRAKYVELMKQLPIGEQFVFWLSLTHIDNAIETALKNAKGGSGAAT